MSIVSQASEHTLMKSLHYVKTMEKLKKGKNKQKKRTNRLIKATTRKKKENNIYIRHLFYKYVKCTSIYTKVPSTVRQCDDRHIET